jgi:hypothetical protein
LTCCRSSTINFASKSRALPNSHPIESAAIPQNAYSVKNAM